MNLCAETCGKVHSWGMGGSIDSKFSKGAMTHKSLEQFYATGRKLRPTCHLGPFTTNLKPPFESLVYVSCFLMHNGYFG